MTRKSIYIRYNQYFSPLPGLSANATPLLYSGTSHRTLKRGKHQILTFHQIKSHPEKVKSLFQCSRNISQIGDKVILSFNQTLNLRKQHTILLFFAAITDTQIFCHTRY